MENRGTKRVCLSSPGTDTYIAPSSSRGFDLNEHLEARKQRSSPSQQHPQKERTFFPTNVDSADDGGVERVLEAKDGPCKGRGGLKGRAATPKDKDKKQPHKVDDAVRSEDVLADLIKVMHNGSGYLLRCRALEYEQLVPVLEGAQSLVEVLVRGMQRACEQEKAKNCEKMNSERAEWQGEMDILRKQHEAEIAALRKNQELEVEKEQERTTCKICLSKPRDAILLPCLHFDYCYLCLQSHQRRSNSCPSCRASISGTLKCNISL